MSGRWRLILLGAAALVLAGGVAARADEDGAQLGQNLAGEACRFGPAPAAATPRTLPILCGTSAAPAGTLSIMPLAARLPDAAVQRRAAITAAAKAVPGGGLGSADAMSCDAGTALAPDGDSLLFACTLAGTGWPHIVVVDATGATLYQGGGLPAMLPVLQAAVAASSGRAVSASETEAAVRLIESKFPGALAHAGGADAASEKALVELARLDGAARNYAGAEGAYRRALEIETRLFGNNGAAVGETLAELALQVSNQGQFDEAAGLFRRAQPIIESVGGVALRARLASYRALDAANQRHFADALTFARSATEMRRAELRNTGVAAVGEGAVGGAPRSVASRGELAHSLRIEANMALRLNDLPTALAAAEEVLSIVSEEPGLPLWWRPDAVGLMAEIDAREGRVVPAERDFREALVMEQKLFGDTAPTAFAEMKLGKFYSDEQLYTAAVAVYRQALGILGRNAVARATIVPDQIVPFLAAAGALAAHDAADRAALQNDMFRASQLVSSDVAGRTIAHAAARLAADNPALADLTREAQDAQRQRDDARIALAAETAKPDDQRRAAREGTLAEDVRAAGAKADALAAQVAKEFPGYAKFADPGPADLATLEQGLGEREALLSFVIGTDSSYALLVERSGMTAARLAVGEAALAADVTELRGAFVPRLGVLPPYDLEAAYELYGKILRPLEGRLGGIDHLVVAPGGALASLPFALLVTEAPRAGARNNYGEAAWLVRRLALSDVPSPRAFLSLRQAAARRTPAPRPLLAVADPASTGAALGANGGGALAALAARCRENGPIPGDLLRALPPLHETAGEVQTIGRLLGAGSDALLLGAAATEAAFRARPLDQYRVLYFATHGLLPGELHCESEPGLVLSPPAAPARTTAEDGVLDASEIAALKLNADLVVLSACNTAAGGGEFGGSALAGLADAFFNAGARAVLASHWEVPSLATVKLMTGLFQAYERGDGVGLAEALRRSQLALIAQGGSAHPFNWAAFTLIGNGAAATLAPAQAEPQGRRS